MQLDDVEQFELFLEALEDLFISLTRLKMMATYIVVDVPCLLNLHLITVHHESLQVIPGDPEVMTEALGEGGLPQRFRSLQCQP